MNDFDNIDEIYVETAINSIYGVNNNIIDLNNSYKSNTGLLINFLINKTSNLNYYDKYVIELSKLYFQLFNLPNINLNSLIDFIPTDLYNYTNFNISTYNITKTNFNNIPITINTYDTVLLLNENNLNKIITKIVQKDSFGNIPSLIFTLSIDEIITIVKSSIITSYLTYTIPILVPWGTVDPTILYHIYNKKIQNKKSYIINFGGCGLDELSAYIQYIKIDRLIKYNNRFNNFFYSSYFTVKNNVTYTMIISNLIFNYKNTYNTNSRYFVDLATNYIIYLGIDNDYGWTYPLLFFKYYSKSLKTYIYNSNSTNYDISINNLSNIYVSSTDVSRNPNVIMINIPKFSSDDEYYTQQYGMLVSKAFDKLDNLIKTDLSNISLSNIYIYVRNYGKEGDLALLKKLYEPSFNKYIPLTTGSFYDFRAENFANTYFDSSKTIFDGLSSIRNFNLSELSLTKLIINKIAIYSDRINDNVLSSNYFNDNTFDQIRYQETLINFLQIIMIINSTQIDTGLVETNDSANFIYKIYSGEQLYNGSLTFDFKKLCDVFGLSYNGYVLNNFIFSGLIPIGYNNNKYWDISNGYPFNRNTFYSVCKKKYNYYDPSVFNATTGIAESPKIDLSINFQWAGIYKYTGDRTDGGYVISFSSDIDFVNALIFKINGDDTNFNIYYKKYMTSMY